MLTIFRRHLAECKFKTRKHKKCQCPIWAQGILDGRKIRKSLDLRNWEAAQKLVRDWEANPNGGAVTVSDACDKFMADAKARNLSDGMIRKQLSFSADSCILDWLDDNWRAHDLIRQQ
jgi:hypothetical protein